MIIVETTEMDITEIIIINIIDKMDIIEKGLIIQEDKIKEMIVEITSK